MHYYEIAPTKIFRNDSDVLTYSSDNAVQVGSIVHVEVGKKTVLGIVIKETSKPSYDTKSILEVLDIKPIPGQLVDLAIWMSSYYKSPLANVLQTILPTGIDKKRRKKEVIQNDISVRKRTKNVLNTDQQRATKEIAAASPGAIILQGITGSGKTEVYKELARQSINSGKSVIILVPEISLTSQIVDEFAMDFPNAIITHSRMTEAERHIAWLEALDSREPRLVIGPRSALFSPLSSVGLIVLDEAHEPSFKQDQSPKYSALRVASVLAKLHNTKAVFGSATPAVADKFLAEANDRPLVIMSKSAKDNVKKPNIQPIDMKDRDNFSGHRFLSDALIEKIRSSLDSKKQSLIFHNRRGSASVTLCENCGWTAVCNRCLVPMVLHNDSFRLSCHICGTSERVPTGCPDCSNAQIIHRGIGTKLIQSELQRLFPKASIARFDSDNSKDETLDKMYGELYSGEIDIAIGTQVVAKGLDLPNLRTVGVIQADSGLSLPDYAASERTFQLLAQVIGRVGRDNNDTDVIVQSYQPADPSVKFGIAQDYESFYEYIIEKRKRGGFPPFRYMLKLTTSHKTERGAVNAAKNLANDLRGLAHKDVQILGPTPAFYERTGSSFRWQLILKSPKREHLTNLIKDIPKNYWQYDLDPSTLL